MAYTPTSWVPGVFGTEITSARLNNIETGVGNAAERESLVATSLRTLGATGVATQDATTAVRDALALVTKGTGVPAISIDIPPGTYRITDTILFDRIAPRMIGAGTGNPTNHSNPGKGTTFIWDGPAGQPMFRVRDCQNFVMEDILLLGNDTNIPSELIYFENDGSGGQVGTNQLISFNRVTFGWYAYATTSYSGHSKTTRGVRFGGTNTNNDQAWFHNCLFGGASDANVAFDNSNTLWCSFVNCMFDGRQVADQTTPTAAGLRTNACVTLVNAQFNRCNPDIDVQNGTTFVYMWNSENSAQFAKLGTAAGLVAYGGAMVAHPLMGATMFDHAGLGTDGELSLTDIRFRTALSLWPKIKARGNTSGVPGRLVVRDCGLPADVYDVQAHATGMGGITVNIDDGDLLQRAHLRAGDVMAQPQATPLRVEGYLSDGSATSALLTQLSAAGLVKNASLPTPTTRTNSLVNPRFVSSATGWTKSANATATTVGETVQMAVNTEIVTGNSLIYNSTGATAVAAEAWSAGVTVQVTGTTAHMWMRLRIYSYSPSSTPIGEQVIEFAPGDTKRMVVDGAVVPTGGTLVRMELAAVSYNLPVGATVTLSKPVLEKAPTTGAPFHGASSITDWSAAWAGTTDNSYSTLTHTGSQAISTVTGLQAALDAKSPLASPTFTGAVTVPTPTTSGHAATKAYVDSSAVGAPGAWVPADNGMVACDVDPLLAVSTYLLATAGSLYLRKMKVATTSAITNVVLQVTNAGATLANAYVAVFDDSGARLGVSADVSTTLQSTGTKTIPLVTPTASQAAGTWLYVAILVGSWATAPTLRSVATGGTNIGLSSNAGYRWASVALAATAMPSSFTPSGVTLMTAATPLLALS